MRGICLCPWGRVASQQPALSRKVLFSYPETGESGCRPRFPQRARAHRPSRKLRPTPPLCRRAMRWGMHLLGYAPPPRLSEQSLVRRHVRSLQQVNDGLAVALGAIHLQADILTRAELPHSSSPCGEGGGGGGSQVLEALGSCACAMSEALQALEVLRPPGGAEADGEEEEEDIEAAGSNGKSLLIMAKTPLGKQQQAVLPSFSRSGSSQALKEHGEGQPLGASQVWVQLRELQATSMRASRNLQVLLQRHRAPTRDEQAWISRQGLLVRCLGIKSGLFGADQYANSIPRREQQLQQPDALNPACLDVAGGCGPPGCQLSAPTWSCIVHSTARTICGVGGSRWSSRSGLSSPTTFWGR